MCVLGKNIKSYLWKIFGNLIMENKKNQIQSSVPKFRLFVVLVRQKHLYSYPTMLKIDVDEKKRLKK